MVHLFLHDLKMLLNLTQRVQFDALNLKLLNISQIYALTLNTKLPYLYMGGWVEKGGGGGAFKRNHIFHSQ